MSASEKALQRETDAKASFSATKAGFEEEHTSESLAPGEKHTLPLLTPDQHLTSHTYRTFTRWVKTHPGWSCKRREASKEECEEHHATNRGKSYFVDVVYQAPDPVKLKRLQETAAKRAAKRAKMEAMVARRDPSATFGKLPEVLQAAVLSYIGDDMPRLRALLSTPHRAVASRDELWEPILQKVLEDKFDHAFYTEWDIERMSERPKKSTEFRAWFSEILAHEEEYEYTRLEDSVYADEDIYFANHIANDDDDDDDSEIVDPKLRWLVHDVSICEYAIRAADFAELGEDRAWEEKYGEMCIVCGESPDCCSCSCPEIY